MKQKRKLIFVLGLAGLAFLLVVSGSLLASGGFELPWWTVDGGGQSSGGNFAVSGSIGQPDAGQATDGIYSVGGGFWRRGENIPPPPPDNRLYLPIVLRG